MTRDYLCRLHPDFHMPEDVEIGAGFDGDAYVGGLKDHGVDLVAMFAKCHYGHSYYPTRVGTVHPKLRLDMLGAVERGCRRHDVGFLAYLSVFLDTCAVRAHPDWALQSQREGVDAGFSSRKKFLRVCVSSPYLAESLLPQCLEVVETYRPDELLLDTMTGFHPCHCRHCRDGFGSAIPASPDEPGWMDYVRWYGGQYERFFARVIDEVHRLDPSVRVAFNWEWSHRRPACPPAHTGMLMGDLLPTGRVASLTCRYFAGTGLPFAYMSGRFLHGLGDWTSTTPLTLTHAAACTIAQGGDYWIIDRQLPDGSLEPRAYDMMREVFDFMGRRRAWVAGTRHVPETAALFAYEHVVGPDLEHFADFDARKRRIEPFEGVNLLMISAGRHYTAVNATTLAERLDAYRLVILPECEHVPQDLLDALAGYVRRGGRVLITQPGDRQAAPAGLLELAGVRAEGFTSLDYGYLDTAPPLRIAAPFARVSLRGSAEALVGHVEPLGGDREGKAFGHGSAPPGEPSGHPAVVRRRLGAGEVIYLAVPAFGEHFRQFSPYLAALVGEQIDRLLPDPIVRVQTPAQVEAVALRKGDDLIVHVVNHSAREQLAGYWHPVFTYMPEVRGAACRIRRPAGAGKYAVRHVPSGEPASCVFEDDAISVSLPPLGVMASLSIADYFQAGAAGS